MCSCRVRQRERGGEGEGDGEGEERSRAERSGKASKASKARQAKGREVDGEGEGEGEGEDNDLSQVFPLCDICVAETSTVGLFVASPPVGGVRGVVAVTWDTSSDQFVWWWQMRCITGPSPSYMVVNERGKSDRLPDQGSLSMFLWNTGSRRRRELDISLTAAGPSTSQ